MIQAPISRRAAVDRYDIFCIFSIFDTCIVIVHEHGNHAAYGHIVSTTIVDNKAGYTIVDNKAGYTIVDNKAG
jgi:hypothetical protein